ncbi:hypothetical protein Tco_1297898 [Tanacetum coccineum]
MTTLKFADTHNIVAFLSKPAKSKGFEQIVDFLNAHPIKHALTVNPTIYTSCIEQFWATVKAKTVNEEVQLQALVDGKKIIITESTVPQSSVPSNSVADEAVYKELDDSLVRATTTASSLEAEHDNGDIIAQARSENVSKLSNDPLLARANTLQSGEDSLKLQELMALCTTLQIRVLDLETTKITQGNEIASLKRRIKKLERRNRSRTHKLKRLYKVGLTARVKSSRDEEILGEDASKQGRISDIDADDDITLVNDDNEMFDVDALAGDEVFVAEQSENVVEKEVVVIDAASTILVSVAIINKDEITLAQVLVELKSAKPKADKDKGKGIMVEEPVVEQVKPIKRLEQMRLDEELVFKLQAKEEEEEMLAREKAQQIKEANIDWDDVQAKVKADYELAQRLQAQEQEELTDEEKARLFVQFLEQRRKHFVAKRAEEKRNKPPTRDQQRNIMCTYLKNMEGWKPKSLKNKSFANIQELFEKAMKMVNTFVDYKIELMEESYKKAETELEENLKKAKAELMEGSSKRAGEKLEQENEEEVAIDVVPLATKPPTIVDWKIHKEGKKSYYQIIRADGKSQMYRVFSQMLKSFSREDLEDLYKLVKAKYGSIRPMEDLDLILYGNLKTMFEPYVEDQVWKNQDDYNVLDWKLYDSCGVHSLRMQKCIHSYAGREEVSS